MQSNANGRLSGLIFGAWLGLVYAYVAIEINRSTLPDLPFAGPLVGDIGYFLEYLAAGALLGLLACWPQRIWVGILLGSVAGVGEFLFLPWRNAMGPVQTPSVDLADFLTLGACLLPMTIALRMAVENLPLRPGKSQILRQIGWPLVATALAIAFGVFALYSLVVRDDLQITRNLMVLSQKSTDASTLPASLKDVQNWFPNATGNYTLSWSKETDLLMWQKLGGTGSPTAARDIAIIVRFGNNFTLGCMFTLGIRIPTCANFEY